MLVMKRSGKPFKNGKIVAAVVGYTINPNGPPKKAARMQDGSIVNLDRLVYKIK